MSSTFADPRLATLDGFRVDFDPARERADVILDRPPLNVISMPQRDQLRLLFEALEEDERVRVIVLRAAETAASAPAPFAFASTPSLPLSAISDSSIVARTTIPAVANR